MSPPLKFDGSYDLARLPVGHSYLLYAEPGDFGVAFNDLCGTNAAPPCTTPAADAGFNPRIRPAAPWNRGGCAEKKNGSRVGEPLTGCYG